MNEKSRLQKKNLIHREIDEFTRMILASEVIRTVNVRETVVNGKFETKRSFILVSTFYPTEYHP
jgi:hypothetical protein